MAVAKQVERVTLTAVQLARSKIIFRNAFFANLILSTPLEMTQTVPRAATDMKKIYINPEFINELSTDVVIFVLLHELFHIILKHGLRQGSRDPDLWNKAGDYAINWQLGKAGIKLWEGCLIDPRFAGMTAEGIYDILKQEENENPGRHKNKQDGIGRDLIPQPATDAERAEIERTINGRVAVAATQARLAGQFSADLERMVNGILQPQIAWEEVLREYMLEISQDNESWSRRNRRFKTIMPSRHSECMGELHVIGDTSGSIGGNTFARVAAELGYIIDVLKPERIRVIWADAVACALEEVFEAGDNLELHPKGGGGTDMRLPLKHSEQFNPIVCVLITDGYTPWPEEEPPYPLIVLCTTDVVAPVGRTIHVTV